MAEDFSALLKKRVERIKFLTSSRQGAHEYLEAGGLALTVIHEAVGGSHPLSAVFENVLKSKDWAGTAAASRALVTLYEQGGLKSPRLAIAHEIEGTLLILHKHRRKQPKRTAMPAKSRFN
jgi:hypothetical protein